MNGDDHTVGDARRDPWSDVEWSVVDCEMDVHMGFDAGIPGNAGVGDGDQEVI